MNAQNIFFTDINFKNKLLLADEFQQIAYDLNNNYIKIDINNDGEISETEALNVYSLHLVFSNISSLTGIAYFTNLIELKLIYNPLNNIDTSQFPQIEVFWCSYCNLSNINLTGLSKLKYFIVYDNNISNIDFTGLPKLEYVFCSNNQLTTLDFSTNPLFNELICSNNNLTSINIKNGASQLINIPQRSNDCWKVGNPNLTTICADENEITPLTSFLAGCNSGAQPTIDSSCVLASEQFLKSEFLVFPNPTNSIVNVKFNSNVNFKNNNNIELLDIQGRVLQSINVSNSQSSLDISGLTNGVYFLKINAGNLTEIERIIKE